MLLGITAKNSQQARLVILVFRYGVRAEVTG